MRQILLVAVMVVAGCAAQGLPIEGGNTGGAGSGGSGGAGGTGGTGGGGNDGDMSRPLGNVGAGCTSACDCVSGLACLMGVCAKSPIGQLYCCDGNDCPMGSFCQSSDGSYGQCGVGGTGGMGGNPGGPPQLLDMGVNGCRQIKCMTNADCMSSGCMMCSRAGTCR